MKRSSPESVNIEKVLSSFSARVPTVFVEDAPLTFVVDNAIYSVNVKGEKCKVKNVDKNVKVSKRIYKVRANKTITDICGA